MMSATSPDPGAGTDAAGAATLADPVAEAQRMVAGAREKGIVLRLQAAVHRPPACASGPPYVRRHA